MRQAISEALRKLVGLPLWAVGRAGSLEWFQFGGPRTVPSFRGGVKEVGEFALHLDCPWRLIGPAGEVLAGDESERAVLAGLASPALVCCGVRAGEHGDFELGFAGGQRLLVEPAEEDDLEYWRLFRPGTDAPHFVVGPQGADPDG